MRIPAFAIGFTAALLFVALTGSPSRAEAEKTPVDCSGSRSLCFVYESCTASSGGICTSWTERYVWYWYR